MKKLLLALLLASGTAPALAQQMPMQDWSGAYLGAQIDYGFGNDSSTTTNLVGTFPVYHDYSSDGGLGGAHAGYNAQFDKIVLGMEADAEAAFLSGQQAVDAYTVTYSSKTTSDFDASVRARVGYAFDRFLFYGTGGVAFGQVKTAYRCNQCVGAAAATSTMNDMRTGWTAGAGIEYSLTDSLSLSLEYRYTDLGSERLRDYEQVADYQDNRFTYDAVRLGISYHF